MYLVLFFCFLLTGLVGYSRTEITATGLFSGLGPELLCRESWISEGWSYTVQPSWALVHTTSNTLKTAHWKWLHTIDELHILSITCINYPLACDHRVHMYVILYLLPPLQDGSISFWLHLYPTERSSQETVLYLCFSIGRQDLFSGIQFFEF